MFLLVNDMIDGKPLYFSLELLTSRSNSSDVSDGAVVAVDDTGVSPVLTYNAKPDFTGYGTHSSINTSGKVRRDTTLESTGSKSLLLQSMLPWWLTAQDDLNTQTVEDASVSIDVPRQRQD
jgi:hypothetical protein